MIFQHLCETDKSKGIPMLFSAIIKLNEKNENDVPRV